MNEPLRSNLYEVEQARMCSDPPKGYLKADWPTDLSQIKSQTNRLTDGLSGVTSLS